MTSGKQLEAVREGIQDYEYFAMLDRAIQGSFCSEGSSNGLRAARSAGMKTIGFTAASHCLDDHGIPFSPMERT